MRTPTDKKPRALGFYRGQAYRAASCGISVDVHCFANKTCEHFGLSSIAPLALTTGGGIHRWGGGGGGAGKKAEGTIITNSVVVFVLLGWGLAEWME